MFVTIGKVAQHVSDMEGLVLLALPHAREATAMEAAECINRLVCGGSAAMHAANEDFKRIYQPALSTADRLKLLPNPSMSGFRATTAIREDEE